MKLLRDMINDPEIEQVVAGWSFPVSLYQQQKWLDTAINDTKTKRMIIEACDVAQPIAIGMIYITDLDWKNRSVATGIKLAGSSPKRKGYATDATMALFRYLFYELQFHRISLKILENNEASRRLYERCGAKCEGVLRQAVYKNGQYLDQYLYAILKSDFDAVEAAHG